MGEASAMGPGYVPWMISVGLAAIGGALVLRGTLCPGRQSAFPLIGWRTILLVLGSVIAFAAALHRLGVVIATLLLVGIAVFAGEQPRLRETVGLMAILSAMVVLVFIKGLGVHMRIWPW
jgi:hypothetical protein